MSVFLQKKKGAGSSHQSPTKILTCKMTCKKKIVSSSNRKYKTGVPTTKGFEVQSLYCLCSRSCIVQCYLEPWRLLLSVSQPRKVTSGGRETHRLRFPVFLSTTNSGEGVTDIKLSYLLFLLLPLFSSPFLSFPFLFPTFSKGKFNGLRHPRRHWYLSYTKSGP